MTPTEKTACIVLAVFVLIPLILHWTGRRRRVTITAAQAQPGDIVWDGTQAWQRTGPEVFNWATFTGPVGYYGPWEDSYGPQGPLTLLVRDGKPAA